MAETKYDDPLAALPTVAPPRVKKKQPDGVSPVDATITENADDYFANFPGVETVNTPPISDPAPVPYTKVDQTMDAPIPAPVPYTPGEQDATKFMPGGSPAYKRVGDTGATMDAMPVPTSPYLGQNIAESPLTTYLNGGKPLPGQAVPGASPVPGGADGIPESDFLPDGNNLATGENPPGDLDAYIRYLLENPSRYDDELVQQGLAQIDKTLADKRESALSDIDERMAQRGLVGSSVEANTGAELAQDLERERSQYAFDLQREMANTRRQDMQAAGQLAVAQRANQLRERGMNLDDAYRQAALEFEQTKFFGDEEGGFPGTFAQEQYLTELDAYYKTLQMLAQTGMSEDDLREWQRKNPRPQPVGGVPEGYEIPEAEPPFVKHGSGG